MLKIYSNLQNGNSYLIHNCWKFEIKLLFSFYTLKKSECKIFIINNSELCFGKEIITHNLPL